MRGDGIELDDSQEALSDPAPRSGRTSVPTEYACGFHYPKNRQRGGKHPQVFARSRIRPNCHSWTEQHPLVDGRERLDLPRHFFLGSGRYRQCRVYSVASLSSTGRASLRGTIRTAAGNILHRLVAVSRDWA